MTSTIGFEDDAPEALAAPDDAALKLVAALAARQAVLRREVAAATAALARLQAELRGNEEKDLPAALTACGYAPPSKLTVAGAEVKFSAQYRGKKLTSPEALAWLDAEGHGDLVKNAISIALNREDDAVADEIEAFCRRHPTAGNSIVVERERSVHQGTIAAFAREMVEGGYDVDLELLGVFVQRFARVKAPDDKGEF